LCALPSTRIELEKNMSDKFVLVTGAAGFIGSNLTDRLLQNGQRVRGFDNFSTGRPEFLESALRSPSFDLREGDLLDLPKLKAAMADVETVYHLAANADVRHGPEHTRKDLEQNTIGTANVLEAMKACGVKRLAFASTGSVYGEPDVFPTPENAPFPIQTSLYAASKLAAEGLIGAYCEAFGIQSWIFRFVSILGERYTHGHVYDFCEQLLRHPESLQVLGNGKQRKSYLYVQDCIDAMFIALERASGKVNIVNLGTDEYCTVDDSIGWITGRLGLNPTRQYAGGERGWVGDSPFIFLNASRIRGLGWKPSLSIRAAVERTVSYLQENHWVLKPASTHYATKGQYSYCYRLFARTRRVRRGSLVEQRSRPPAGSQVGDSLEGITAPFAGNLSGSAAGPRVCRRSLRLSRSRSDCGGGAPPVVKHGHSREQRRHGRTDRNGGGQLLERLAGHYPGQPLSAGGTLPALDQVDARDRWGPNRKPRRRRRYWPPPELFGIRHGEVRIGAIQ
jgi:UDP-glucose 4-epimerase